MKLKCHSKAICGIFILSFAIVSSYTLLLNKIPLLKINYLKTSDLFLSLRYKFSRMPAVIDKICIIDIDENTLNRLQQRWPIRRNFYAKMLRQISQDNTKPAITGINIAFIGKGDLPEDDAALADAIKESDNVVLGTFLDKNYNMMLPLEAISQSAKAVGFVNFPRDVDYTIRRVRPVICNNDKLDYAFILKIGSIFSGLDLKNSFCDLRKQTLKLASPLGKGKDVVIPMDTLTNSARINYFAKFNDFKTIPLWQVLENPQSLVILKDKIVIAGTTMELLHDIHPTPMGLMPGLCINANFLISFLLNRFLVTTPVFLTFFILLFAVFIIGWVTYRYSGIWGFITLLAASAIAVAGSYIAVTKDVIFNLSGFLITTLLSFIIVSAYRNLSLVIANIRLNKAALTDPLTGVYIKHYFDVKIENEIRRAQAEKTNMSLVIFDIDKMQDINGTLGYEAGNLTLKQFSALLKTNSRPTDSISRLDGTQFAAILTHTNLDGAKKYAEKICKLAETVLIDWQGKQIKITVSAGVSGLTEEFNNAQSIVNAASQALKSATQNNGSNNIKSLP